MNSIIKINQEIADARNTNQCRSVDINQLSKSISVQSEEEFEQENFKVIETKSSGKFKQLEMADIKSVHSSNDVKKSQFMTMNSHPNLNSQNNRNASLIHQILPAEALDEIKKLQQK